MGWLPSAQRVQAVCAPMALACLLMACATPQRTAEGPDTRAPIKLSEQEAAEFRAGMHAYLDATEAIVEAVAANKVPEAAASARKAGTGAISGVSPALAVSLPPELAMLALDTHQKFDDIAAAAERNASKKEILDKLGSALANCSACHSSYRIAD